MGANLIQQVFKRVDNVSCTRFRIQLAAFLVRCWGDAFFQLDKGSLVTLIATPITSLSTSVAARRIG